MWKYGGCDIKHSALSVYFSSSKEDFFKRLDNLSDVALRFF